MIARWDVQRDINAAGIAFFTGYTVRFLTSAFPSTHLTDFTHDPPFTGAPLRLNAMTLQPAATSCVQNPHEQSQQRKFDRCQVRIDCIT